MLNQKPSILAPIATLFCLSQLFQVNPAFATPSDQKPTGAANSSKVGAAKAGAAKPASPNRPGSNYNRDPIEFKHNRVDRLPALSDLPPYTGANLQFLRGEEFPNAKGGKVVTYSFNTSDANDKVIGWYQQVLSASGWNAVIQNSTRIKSSSCLSATKKGSSCYVTTQPAGKKKLNVRIHIHYVSADLPPN